MMRKILFILLLCCIAIAVQAKGTEVYIGGITFEINEEKTEACVMPLGKKEKYQGDINIPSSIYYFEKDIPVTRIYDYAFNGCTDVANISIPASVKTISRDAFKDCAFTSVTYESEDQFYNTVYENTKSNPLSFTQSLYIGGTEITSITIKHNVPDYAFFYATWLKEVILPDSITTLGIGAFAYCRGLTSITLPSSITTIKDMAFKSCNFTSVDLPSPCNLGIEIFEDCKKLETVTLPDNITTIPMSMFNNCNALRISTLPSKVEIIEQKAFMNCHSLTQLPTTNKLKKILSSAFEGCRGLTTLIIPETIEEIGEKAFDCRNLKEVYCKAEVVPNTSENAFGDRQNEMTLYVPYSSLNEYQNKEPWVTFKVVEGIAPSLIIFFVDDEEYFRISQRGGTVVDTKGLKDPDCEIFSGWDKEIPNIMPNDDLLIYGYTSKTYTKDSINYILHHQELKNGKDLPYRAEIVGRTKDFAPADSLLTFPECFDYDSICYNVTTIANEAFKGDSIIKSVRLHHYINEIGTAAFKDCANLTSFNMSATLLDSIPAYLCEGCRKLSELALPTNTKKINKYAFRDCFALTDMPACNNVQELGEGAFANCRGFTTLLFNNAPNIRNIFNDAFTGCMNLSLVNLPAKLKILGDGAFGNCPKLQEVYCRADSLSETHVNAFAGRQTEMTLYVPASAYDYYNSHLPWSEFQSIHSRITSTITFYVDDKSYFQITQESGTVVNTAQLKDPDTGSDGIFSGWDKTIPEIMPNDNMTICGYIARQYSNNGIKYLLHPKEEMNGTNRPNRAEAVGLRAGFTPEGGVLSFPDSLIYSDSIKFAVTRINDEAFKGATTIKSVTFPSGIKEIGTAAFKGCTNMTSVKLPDVIITVPDYLFEGCRKLTYVTLAKNTKRIGKYAFRDCFSLTDLPVGKNIVELNEGAFANCTGLKTLFFDTTPSVKYLYKDAFTGCTNLYSVTLPDTIKMIDQGVFGNCPKLKTVYCHTPKVLSTSINAFAGRQTEMDLYVPDTAVVAYQQAVPWSTFANIYGIIKDNAINYFVNDTTYYQVEIKTGKRVQFSRPKEPTDGVFSGWDKQELPTVMPNEPINIYGYVSHEVIDQGITYLARPEERLNGKDLDRRAEIVSADSTITSAVIPDSISYEEINYPITAVQDSAFTSCSQLATLTLLGSTLPEAVKTCFNDSTYANCLLRTDIETLTGPCWPLFQHVEPLTASGIHTVKSDAIRPDAPIYDLNGRLAAPAGTALRHLPRGIYIQQRRKIVIQ